mmetsp:Transcript_94846/g.265592  ORF Transcript_94846/g.265592 Transcript_94846/m.265592 type:complete len:217 (-) Transcript_94846:430-1080(-)
MPRSEAAPAPLCSEPFGVTASCSNFFIFLSKNAQRASSSSFFCSFFVSVLTSPMCSATTPVSNDNMAKPIRKMYRKNTNHIAGSSSYTCREMFVQSSSVRNWNKVTNDLPTEPQYLSMSSLTLKNKSPGSVASLAWLPAMSVSTMAKMSMNINISNAIQNTVPMESKRPTAKLLSCVQARKIRSTRSVRRILKTRKIRSTPKPWPASSAMSRGCNH